MTKYCTCGQVLWVRQRFEVISLQELDDVTEVFDTDGNPITNCPNCDAWINPAELLTLGGLERAGVTPLPVERESC